MLRHAGAEVVTGDISDRESVKAAISCAYGVFVVTPILPDEEQVGKAVVEECKEAGIQHVVFSGAESVKDEIGKTCTFFDSKFAVEKYLDEIGVPNTSIRYPFYFENFLTFFPLSAEADGTYSLTLPMDGPLDAMSVPDGAPIVVNVFQNPQQYLALSAERKSISELLQIISKVTGKVIKYNQVSFEQFANQPQNPLATDLSIMFEYYSKVSPMVNQEFTRRLNPEALTFQQWAETNKDKLLASIIPNAVDMM